MAKKRRKKIAAHERNGGYAWQNDNFRMLNVIFENPCLNQLPIQEDPEETKTIIYPRFISSGTFFIVFID